MKHKLILQTVAVTLIIELLLGIVAGFIIYTNYDKLTASKSGVSTNIVELKEIEVEDIVLEEKDEENENILYEGNMGRIEYFYTKNKTENTLLEEKKIIFNFEQDIINKYIIINFLNENNLLDKYIYNYLVINNIKNPSNEFENIINYSILLDSITPDKGTELVQKYQEVFKKENDFIVSNINEDKFEDVANKLKEIESKKSFKELPDNILGNTGILKDENFQYILGKLYDDIYLGNIKKASNVTGVDYKLILSSIAVEQLRYLTTDRGYAKTLIKNNKYLTTFTKFSYGLGGIKTHTFNNINYWIKSYNSTLYNNHFKSYDEQCLNISDETLNTYSDEVKVDEEPEYNEEKIKEVLETPYGGTLYVGGLVYSIQQKRKRAGFNIDDKPGVIITLYNMGNNKTPHGSPDLGGSLISVTDDKKLYFGEIGFIYFNYIKYYIDNNVTIKEIDETKENIIEVENIKED